MRSLHKENRSPFIVLVLLWFMGIGHMTAQITDQPETAVPAEGEEEPIYWTVKAHRPDAQLMDIKAIDKKGNRHEVRAIQQSSDASMLSVKAMVDGEALPIKLVEKGGEQFYPVKAIDHDGFLIGIKAETETGGLLDVKGVSQTGNIVHLRAINKYLKYYNIIAISPEGKVYDVKGLKMLDTPVETVINGVRIFAHVKSLAQ
ncbi:MAG: hypothetical protein HKP24_00225 [Croceitalea sp.]|nr:hypothetical protein [Croceitalea sp.]